MRKRLIENDPLTGVTTWHHYDEQTGKSYVESVQDVEPILDLNKFYFNDETKKQRGIKSGMLHAASIPVTVQHKWLRDYGIDVLNKDHFPAVKRLLNSPDWKYLKTANITI